MALVVIPAIDILDGKCVRLTQGDYTQVRVYSQDPAEVARAFVAAGARRLHVVDLDAARSRGDNRTVIGEILERTGMQVQVAGGVRSLKDVDDLVRLGAHWVVMGTAAVREPALFELCAQRHPNRILAALDMRDGKPAIRGWMETSDEMVSALVERWDRLPLAGVTLTCIDRDGTLSGPDLETLSSVRVMTGLDLQYSGGISAVDDLDGVAAAGAQAAIVGKAIYEGTIKLEEAVSR